MDDEELFSVSIPGLQPKQANHALRDAINAISKRDRPFHERFVRNGVRYILDAHFGTVRLPKADAERVKDELRAAGHQASVDPLPPPPTLAERNRAKADWLRSLRKGTGLVSEETMLVEDVARLDAEQPGWDRDSKIAAARVFLKSGSPREVAVNIYGEQLVAEAEALNANEG